MTEDWSKTGSVHSKTEVNMVVYILGLKQI